MMEHETKQVSDGAVLKLPVDLVCCGFHGLFLKKFQHMSRLLGSGVKSLLIPHPMKNVFEFLIFTWFAQLQRTASFGEKRANVCPLNRVEFGLQLLWDEGALCI